MTSQDSIDRSTPVIPARAREAHKGRFGRVLVIAGCGTMPGAAALSTLAALRGGAGLVTLASTEDVLARLTPALLCATQLPLPAAEDGTIAARAARIIGSRRQDFDAFALGPGLGITPSTREFFAELLNGWPGPLVLDADALNLLAEDLGLWRGESAVRVITPHPGEMARLTGRGPLTSRSERREWAEELAARLGCIVVLKGSRSVITDGCTTCENSTGNPGMASGGRGDGLTGLVAARLAQPGSAALEAVRVAVHAHGLAGDLAARSLGEEGLTAQDVLEQVPLALRSMTAIAAADQGSEA